jgi:predicted NBD/HSP70 family sugar kinase
VEPSRIRHLQIGFPGAYDARTDTLHQAAVPGWARPGILGEIAAAVGLPGDAIVALDNDVKLAAIAERHRGVATAADSFCLLWLGAGVGLATDLGGVLLRGSRGGAGEIGYLPVCAGHAPGPATGSGDLQDLIGGPAVLALAAEFGIDATSPGEAMAVAVANHVDPVVQRLAERIAFALATVIAVLDPPLVVLAGEVAQAGGARLRDAVAAAVHPSTPAPFPGLTEGDVEIAVTAVDDDAVLLGGLDAGLSALHESLISSLAQPSTD